VISPNIVACKLQVPATTGKITSLYLKYLSFIMAARLAYVSLNTS